MNSYQKTVGILGGMGPEATVDLMHRVIRATPATDDCDHIHLVVDSNPQVPSRIKALIEKTGQDPLPCLQEMARKLEAWGVDFLAMPCNTAHYYHARIQSVVGIPLLDMIEVSVANILSLSPKVQAIGLLASTAVLNLGLYDRAFALQSITALHPDTQLQNRLMRAIQNIKTGRYGEGEQKALQHAADNLVHKGAKALLIACTELSILAQGLQSAIPCRDGSQMLAEAIVQEARG
ncbi:MAG: amino acid racemase [Desulfovermiculus sp.]